MELNANRSPAKSLTSAAVAAMSWISVIERTDLGYAYPFMALSFVLVSLGAAVLFKGSVSVMQTVGLAMIVAGVASSALARRALGFPESKRESPHSAGRSVDALGGSLGDSVSRRTTATIQFLPNSRDRRPRRPGASAFRSFPHCVIRATVGGPGQEAGKPTSHRGHWPVPL
jgi:multidrug transporter EmrE-like cation transporter